MDGTAPDSDGSLWVFGYGSLMWRPGFAYARRCKALLRGWRRSLCVFSHVYRGSPERPGLVLGLDRGGACPGVAFEVDAALREPTIRYLREREQVTAVYLERVAPITLEAGHRVLAMTYVADRLHDQYAGASIARRCSNTCALAKASPVIMRNMSSRPTTISWL
jgi:cation transport protein ChaC